MGNRLLRVSGLFVLTAVVALGASALATQRALAAAPTITGITPTSGPIGTVVEIDGTNFVPGSTTVAFGAAPATNITCTSTTVCFAIAPTGTGAVNVTATTAGGPATSPMQFTYAAGSATPAITSISPTGGPAGTPVTITGTNLFPGGTSASFGGTPATVTCTSSTSCTTTAPAGSGTVNVTVTTPSGTSGPVSYNYAATGTGPVITQIQPSSGTVGTSVTLTGTGFVPGATTVMFGTQSATATCSNTVCTVSAPSQPFGATAVSVTAQTAAGTSNPVSFSYTSSGGCPVGTVLIGGSCVPISGGGCPAGTVLIGTSCVPTSGSGFCPAGTVLVGTTCQSSSSTTNSLGTVQGTVGQTLSFTAPTSATGMPFDTVFSWSFGDGSTATGPTVTHAYSAAGNYTVTMTASSASTGFGGSASGTAVITGTNSTSSVPTTTTGSTTTSPTGPTATFEAGWNLVSGPSGTVFSGAANPLYTFQAGDSNYEAVPDTTGITGGRGYWAYFTGPTTVALTGSGPALPLTLSIPAGQWVMVGNPSPTQSVTVSGADVVYTFSPGASNYQGGGTSATLQPGQAAWVYSTNGATITIR